MSIDSYYSDYFSGVHRRNEGTGIRVLDQYTVLGWNGTGFRPTGILVHLYQVSFSSIVSIPTGTGLERRRRCKDSTVLRQ